ncbi:transposase [Streptomyces anulatus]|uniref:transposase n=1 Tax=Streptomyces anulatus TaxID=1892 RepID=UPI0036DA7084
MLLLWRIQVAEDAAGQVDGDVSVESTAVRAHQYAAGARKASAVAAPQKWIAGGNRVDPVLRKPTVRLEEVVRAASGLDVPAADSPPKTTLPPTGDAGPSPSS